VFGERPHLPSPPKERRTEADGRVHFASLKRPVVVPPPTTITLPKTATDAELNMIIGAVLLMFSLILLVFNRRQRWRADAG
jgi:Ca-activated chloride channel family protein